MAASSSGVLPTGSPPSFAMNASTSEALRAFRISEFSLSMMGLGVPAGMNIAYQLSTSKPGYIEFMVGSLGYALAGFAVVTAIALTLPDATCGATASAVPNSKSTSPLISAIIAGPPPLYDTFTMLAPVLCFNISTARKLVVPAPLLPALSLPVVFASPISSFTDLAGTLGCVTSTSGTEEIQLTGASSLMGSN